MDAGRLAQWEAGLDDAAMRGRQAGRDPARKDQFALELTRDPGLPPLREKLPSTE